MADQTIVYLSAEAVRALIKSKKVTHIKLEIPKKSLSDIEKLKKKAKKSKPKPTTNTNSFAAITTTSTVIPESLSSDSEVIKINASGLDNKETTLISSMLALCPDPCGTSKGTRPTG